MSLFERDGSALPAAPLRIRGCEVLVGTCSWADRGMVAGDFYPRGAKTDPRARLQFYASVFPTVEVDASFHALQPTDRARQWLEWTVPTFRFNVKAFAWLTGHESDPKRLPPQIAALLPPALRDAGSVRAARVPEEALTAAWDHFAAFVDVFARAGRLGYVLFQFPKGQGFSPELFAYLDAWMPYLRAWPVAVEIRHKAWLSRRHRETFLGYLRAHGFAYVVPDMAQVQYLPPPEAAVTTRWSVIRFHGRNPALVQRRVSTDVAYDYLYSRDELQAWARTARGLARDVDALYLMFNNHARGQAARNAREMVGLLAQPD
ncbi:MAG: DUF72 domain-containing protein [Armatimonadota bacterium]|nr:DUF72 domain-containing protein [Armatimonadota bacterium]MDR7518637.1 DUF72 domain-containing protein [Armatimonadota bacterium]MDR7549829.1 DUF72 domain-containing protein [Armatimonadota bacterium]